MGAWRSKHWDQPDFECKVEDLLCGTDAEIIEAIKECQHATEEDTYLFGYMQQFVDTHVSYKEWVDVWIARAIGQVPTSKVLHHRTIPPLIIYLIKQSPQYDKCMQCLFHLLVQYTVGTWMPIEIYDMILREKLLQHIIPNLQSSDAACIFHLDVERLPPSQRLQSALCQIAINCCKKSLKTSYSTTNLPPIPISNQKLQRSHESHTTTVRERLSVEFRQLKELTLVHALDTSTPWYVNPLLLPKNCPEDYCVIDAQGQDYQAVMELYAKCPVPHYTIKSVKVVHNERLKKLFEGRINFLEKRYNKPVFAPRWMIQCKTHAEMLKRKQALSMLGKLAYAYNKAPHVAVLPLWHGTKDSILESLFTTGYANFASTDSGYFGKGIYSTANAEYAFRVYSKGALLVNWVAVFSAFPVLFEDEQHLKAKGNFQNYDAHFAPVYSAKHPRAKAYHACKEGEQHQYTELVVFETAQVLPHYIVELQPSLPRNPFNSIPPTKPESGQEQSKSNPPLVTVSPPQAAEVKPMNSGICVICTFGF